MGRGNSREGGGGRLEQHFDDGVVSGARGAVQHGEAEAVDVCGGRARVQQHLGHHCERARAARLGLAPRAA